ncbi:MAG TPA: DoxX family membrane protein [Flavobacterium sp.]|jgi:uncharacterized membrane protein YphA (DoxX/SURF4 family)
MVTETKAVSKVRTAIEQRGTDILRISLGVVFFWFGFLKFFGETSAAEEIASRTISVITFGLMESDISMPVLAVIECAIGIGLLFKNLMRFAIPLLYFQMAGTVLPLFIFASDTWVSAPFVPTLLGQYIIKNCILISAGIVLGVVSKGGELIADPAVAQPAKEIEKKRVEEKFD